MTTTTDLRTIILEYICPALGAVMANIMFSAPYRDLQAAIKCGHLGDLNPTPWAFMLGNCFGWVTYGILIRNFWIYFANAPGFLLSIWLNLGAAKLIYQGHYAQEMRSSFVKYLQDSSSSKKRQTLEQEQQPTTATAAVTSTASAVASTVTDFAKIVWDVTSQTTPAPVQHETMVLSISFIWMACISFLVFADNTSFSAKELTVGILVNLNLVFFYGAPLSTIWTVLSSQSSSSIHIPTMITNTLNGSFWTAYGLAVNDYYVYVPNGLGAALGAIQIILCVIFPRTTNTNSTALTSSNIRTNAITENDIERQQQKESQYAMDVTTTDAIGSDTASKAEAMSDEDPNDEVLIPAPNASISVAAVEEQNQPLMVSEDLDKSLRK